MTRHHAQHLTRIRFGRQGPLFRLFLITTVSSACLMIYGMYILNSSEPLPRLLTSDASPTINRHSQESIAPFITGQVSVTDGTANTNSVAIVEQLRLNQTKQPDFDIYLSIVVCSRLDGYGDRSSGSKIQRTRNFIASAAALASSARTHVELLFVDWNPVPGTQSLLTKFMPWPHGDGFLHVRVLTVPSYVHRRLPNSKHLAVFEFIGRNAATRRARGEYILGTAVDDVFSSELADYLIRRIFRPHTLYRSPRASIDVHVPRQEPCPRALSRACALRAKEQYPHPVYEKGEANCDCGSANQGSCSLEYNDGSNCWSICCARAHAQNVPQNCARVAYCDCGWANEGACSPENKDDSECWPMCCACWKRLQLNGNENRSSDDSSRLAHTSESAPLASSLPEVGIHGKPLTPAVFEHAA